MSTKAKEKSASSAHTRYEDDVYSWVLEQIGLLRAGRLSEVDALNVAEELSDVGNELRDKLESAIAVLTMHLLKWDHQPKLRSRSWEGSIREQRRRIERLLKRNPGLKGVLDEAMDEGYADGRDRVVTETGLSYGMFPKVRPYSFDEMMTRDVEFTAKRRR